MKLIACQQENHLQGITTKSPLGIDLLAEEGSPYTATFNLFDDPAATNLRGLWKKWTSYEQGEVTYVTPEGPESGDTSERTPSAFGAWVAQRRTQHAEPGKPESKLFWIAMKELDLAGKTVWFVADSRYKEGMEAQCTVSGGNIDLVLTAAQTLNRPTSLGYRIEVREGASVAYYVAQGQIIFRPETTLDLGLSPKTTSSRRTNSTRTSEVPISAAFTILSGSWLTPGQRAGAREGLSSLSPFRAAGPHSSPPLP
jgi:hypothetical protein